jgi:hypothetical protein
MALRSINLAAHFALEWCALAAVAYWGFRAGQGWLPQIALGIGVPLAAAAAWAVFRVPGDPGPAPVAVPGPVRLVFELAVFGLAVGCLAAAGQSALAAVLALAVAVNYILMRDRIAWLWRRR